MRRRRALGIALSLGAASLVASVAPVAALELNGGCNVTLTSADANGTTLDTASGPGDGGTQGDPFLIDWDGTVSWQSSSGSQVFTEHSWQTYVFLIPTPVRGGHPNDGRDTTGEGTAAVGENAPFRFTGLYYVSGEINGEDGTHCDGSGWFKLTGDPVGTVPFFVALVSIALGLVTLAFTRPTNVTGVSR